MLTAATNAYKQWHETFTRLPRTSRFTFGTKIENYFTDLIELILLAGYSPREHKRALIEQASAKLDTLKFFIQLAWEMKLLDHKKYAAITPHLAEIGKMLGSWLNFMTKENRMP